ncbi:MAG: imidazole glycerol phosphate synthase subunit HisH [Rhodocyclales bacterium]|nr:imidazole glycerol phosphate synthase subunit HisH [Rhodocyclales bacterium]
MIGVVDYGSGNLLSVTNALAMVGADAQLCSTPEQLAGAERIILPGVGAFGNCLDNLRCRGFDQALDELVIRQRRPILGICVGMQLMARKSLEGGEHAGLGWLDAEVVRLVPQPEQLRVPQIGWNDIEFRANCPLFAGLRQGTDVYFVHSYGMNCRDETDVGAWCDYGGRVTAAVWRDNIVGTQFHPEKSQDIGLRILENFVRWTPC